MQNIDGFLFTDLDSEDEAWVSVRARERIIALGLGVKHNGDLDVAFQREDCKRLVKALEDAIKRAEAKDS